MKVVYESNAGHTERYAKLYAEREGLEVYPLKQALKELKEKEEVVYFGWLKAGAVMGLPKASSYLEVRMICAVGMSAPTEEVRADVATRNDIPDRVPTYYLLGGYEKKKVHGINRLMMGMLCKFLRKDLQAKQAAGMPLTEDEEIILRECTTGADYVDASRLPPDVETALREAEERRERLAATAKDADAEEAPTAEDNDTDN